MESCRLPWVSANVIPALIPLHCGLLIASLSPFSQLTLHAFYALQLFELATTPHYYSKVYLEELHLSNVPFVLSAGLLQGNTVSSSDAYTPAVPLPKKGPL